MRTVKHPGEPLYPRHLLEWSGEGGLFHVTVPAGSDLIGSLHAALKARGVVSAGIVLLGGTAARLEFLTGRPLQESEQGEHHGRVATWNGPHTIDCPATLIGGSAAHGPGEDGPGSYGQPVTHCHALFTDKNGNLRGGHLITGECIAGPGGIRLWVTGLTGKGFRATHDSETSFLIFHPLDLPGAPS